MIDRNDLINHILMMMKFDIEYARYALRQFNQWLPGIDLINGVRTALKESGK